MKQNEMIKLLSDKELKLQLFISQLLLIILSVILSLFFFDSFSDWKTYFIWNPSDIITYGFLVGIIIVFIDIILMKFVPSKYYDDGGINKRIFRNTSIPYIFVITLFIAVAEELLFRGVLQTTFGYIIASLIFALVHFRYLNKLFLFSSILLISFLLGFIFEITNNLSVTIVTHFTVDFLLGVIISLKYRGE
mgnify:CR=1 FL=1